MAPSSPDLAVWTGNDGAVRHDGTVLLSGQTVCEVSRGEAEASDHWQPCDKNGKPITGKAKAPKAPKAKRPARAKTAPSESAGTGEAAGAPSEPTKATEGEG